MLLGGCAASPAPDPALLQYDPALLTGERLFGHSLDTDLAPDADVTGADAAMRAYVEEKVQDAHLSVTRLRQLIQALLDDGYFVNASYNPDETLTAAEAFRSRTGNCLSYTNLFVALAREAGLDAVYQVVDVPPSWAADSGFLIRYTHINVLMRGMTLDRGYGEIVTVDFNVLQPDPEHARRPVSDAYAASLYYANHSVDLLRRNRLREAFAYLRRAIELEPRNADLWVNLAAVYGSRKDIASAIEAYEVALQIDPRSRAALAGLARSHANSGNAALAAIYEEQARNYLEANPYYHLAVAQAEYLRNEHAAALESINRALQLEKRSGRLHFVKGLIEEQLGDLDAARASYRLAKRYGVSNRQKLERIERAVGLGRF